MTTAAADLTTINHAFQESVARQAAKTALMVKAGKAYQSISYADLADRIHKMASGLTALGIAKGDRVAVLSENRPEWAVADLAILALGGVNVPLYTTLPAPQIAYILQNSGAKAIVLSDAKQLQKTLTARAECPDLSCIVTMDAAASEGDASVMTLDDLLARGAQHPLSQTGYAARWKSVAPGDVASIVYTSGTTGDPKGAMLTHGSFMADVDAALAHFAGAGEAVTANDVFLSFLPLCHVFERTTGYYLPLRVGGTIGYAEGVFALVNNMAEVKPTLMVSVPRVYESMEEKIRDTVAKAPAKRQAIFAQALAAGKQVGERRRRGQSVGPLLGVKKLVFDKLVFSKMRERFGGRLRFLVSGGAALSADTAGFFEAIGIPIMEGYGMTETSPCISANPNNAPRLGTVGTALPGVELKIAGDGEILVRGPILMKGYWNNESATAQIIDAQGWLHTGDIGTYDNGYLKITDRKKDIIVLANGKNVAPQPIEQALKQSPFLSEIVLIGDQQNTITALVLPNREKLRDWAKSEGLKFADDNELLALAQAKRKIKTEIDAHSQHLADFEKVKKFTLLSATFSVESGELTPTLKIKRKVVMQRYAREIADLRGGGEATVAAATA